MKSCYSIRKKTFWFQLTILEPRQLMNFYNSGTSIRYLFQIGNAAVKSWQLRSTNLHWLAQTGIAPDIWLVRLPNERLKQITSNFDWLQSQRLCNRKSCRFATDSYFCAPLFTSCSTKSHAKNKRLFKFLFTDQKRQIKYTNFASK